MINMDHFANVSDLECECIGWCRASITPFTDHHPNCPKYNDSLIDVWVVSDGKSKYYDTKEWYAYDICQEGEGLTMTKEKMHSEIYANLPEFDGF